MKLSEAISKYANYCEGQGLTPSTLNAYAYGLKRLGDHLPDIELEAVVAEDLDGWLTQLRRARKRGGEKLSQSTIQQCYRSAHSFFQWCLKRKHLAHSPMEAVNRPKIDSVLRRYLKLEEIPKLLDAAATGRYAARDLVILMLMVDCGPRLAEVANLSVEDVDLTERTVSIKRGKGGTGRVVPIVSATVYALRCWLAVRPTTWRKRSPVDGRSLFGLSRVGVRMMVQRAAHRAGLDITAHGLRHSFATHYEGQLDDLQQILGHANITTTLMIYRHRSTEHARRYHEERSPLAILSRVPHNPE